MKGNKKIIATINELPRDELTAIKMCRVLHFTDNPTYDSFVIVF